MAAMPERAEVCGWMRSAPNSWPSRWRYQHPWRLRPSRARAGEVQPEDADGAAVGLAEAEDALQGGGLARPVGAARPNTIPGTDGEGDVVDGYGPAVALVEAGHLDDRGCGKHGPTMTGRPFGPHRPVGHTGISRSVDADLVDRAMPKWRRFGMLGS